MYPVDGWELIKKDFGYEDNGTPSNPAASRLYMILYNKYRGVLRVFVARGDQQPYNGATIKLNFNSNSASITSLLDYAAEVHALNDFPFDKANNSPVISQVSPFITSPLVWFYADFPLMYDPCTCFYQSLLNVDITLSSTSNVSLTGNLTGSIVTNGASDGGSSTDYGVSSTEDRTLGTTKVGKLITAFEGVDAFKSKSQSVASNLNVTGNGNIINGLTNLTTEMKKSSFLQTGLSMIPYIGDAISLWDAIVGGGKSASGPQQVEILPLSVNLGVNISGSINTQNSYSGSVYRTPGSDVTTAPDYAYAYYNEVLGVINLLKKPQVQLLQRDVPMSPGTYRKETYIKLSEPLQFVLNPASLVDIVEIKGSYVSSFIGSMSGSIGNVTVSPENSGNYRTEYWDATSLPNTELISRTTGSQGGDYPSAPLKLKLMINLKRKNATANTQNILIVLTYPVSYTYTYSTSTTELNNFRNTTSATSYTVDNAIVTSFCQSTAYKTASRGLRYANQYNENIELMREAEKKYARTNMTNLIGINKFEVSPNPAKTNTNISFQLKKKGHVNITVTDGLGRNIKTLLTTTGQEGIKYSLNFNVSNFNSGVYIIKIQSGDYLEIRKILIIK